MPRVAVLGASGAVGTEILRLLDERDFPVDGAPVLLASPRSAGRRVAWRDTEIEIRAVDAAAFDGVDVAIFSAGATRSREWAPVAVDAGAVVVDNSSAFRMDPQVPLVVSEVNPDTATQRPLGIVANPNCTTMVLMVAVKPLHDAFGLTEVVATSYQAAGGAGMSGIDELISQARAFVDQADALRLDGAAVEGSVDPEVFSRAIAFNVLPHCGSFGDNHHTDEEMKLVNESRRILDLPGLAVSPTCVRVPVVVGHGIAARLRFSSPVDRDAALQTLAGAPGLRVVDGDGRGDEPLEYPTPLASAGRDEVLVGRVRGDLSDPRALNVFVVGDNLRKGAALNAVQIAELVVAEG